MSDIDWAIVIQAQCVWYVYTPRSSPLGSTVYRPLTLTLRKLRSLSSFSRKGPFFSSSTSQAAHTKRPWRNAASGEAAQTAKEPGRSSKTAVSGSFHKFLEWLTMIPIERVGIHAILPTSNTQNSTRVEVDNLRLRRVCLICYLLQ